MEPILFFFLDMPDTQMPSLKRGFQTGDSRMRNDKRLLSRFYCCISLGLRCLSTSPCSQQSFKKSSCTHIKSTSLYTKTCEFLAQTKGLSDLYGFHLTSHGGGTRAGLEVGLRVIFPGWSVGGGEVIHRVHLRRERERQDGGVGEDTEVRKDK